MLTNYTNAPQIDFGIIEIADAMPQVWIIMGGVVFSALPGIQLLRQGAYPRSKSSDINIVDIDLKIKNYRCFREPATISLRSGLTGLLGVNNAGKSSLLRFFYECRDIFSKAENSSIQNISELLTGQGKPFVAASSIFDYDEMFWDENEQDIEIALTFNDIALVKDKLLPLRLDLTLKRAEHYWNITSVVVGERKYAPGIYGEIERENSDVFRLGRLAELSGDSFSGTFELLRRTMYVGAHRNILDIGVVQNPSEVRYYDIQIGRTFVENWRRLKTGRSKREYGLAKRVSADIKRIFEFNTLEINPADDLTTLQVIVNGKSYRLPELGSGIGQFIVVLANAAINQPSYILIDEPEVSLHPSLQFDFLESLASYATEGVLFATHSLGLAKGYSDRVYSVRKKTDGSSEVMDYDSMPRLSEFLGELSYSGYKELGFDKILLVEGPTEVKVLQQWLRLYRLAHKVVLIHLGGGSSIHGKSETELQEITRISKNVYALIDSEVTGENKPLKKDRRAFVGNCKAAGIHCVFTRRRATENYFPLRAIRKALGEGFQELQPYQSLKDVTPRWNKRQNWRIAREMTLADLEGTDLADFFRELQAD